MDKVLLELTPPTRRTTQKSINEKIATYADFIKKFKNISMINIPEVVEENHIGQPFYRNMDNVDFGKLIREETKKELLINKVVVHFKSKEFFGQWLDEVCSKDIINNFIFVGGYRDFHYTGPSVHEANSIAKNKEINFGNIAIPKRPNEVENLIAKTKSGASFFSTQIIFDNNILINLLKSYQQQCSNANLKPAMFYLSFAPVSEKYDLEYIRWLGAEFSEANWRTLIASKNIAGDCVEVIIDLINKINDGIEKQDIKVPIGLNIENVAHHNLEVTEKLFDRL